MMNQYRADFPMLNQTMDGKPLIYLDNAATTLKPNSVIKTINEFYTTEYSTVHRGVYWLCQRATEKYDEVRSKVKALINAQSDREIVFTKGTTDSINLIAHSFKSTINGTPEIIITESEHHANIIPWQQHNYHIKVARIHDSGELDIDHFKSLLSPNTDLVSIAHISNALGSIHDIKQIIKLAHDVNAKVLIDGAQAIAHTTVDVQELDCDFYVFSSHKLYGPTGVGILYGKYSLLAKLPPYQVGGDMIEQVSFEKTTFAKPPLRFEAGTPAIAQIIGLGAAIDYIQAIGLPKIDAYEQELLNDATQKINTIDHVSIIGTAPKKSAIISFKINGVHPHDIGTILDNQGVAIRAGHHCAQPLMKRLNVPATARASFSFYNTKSDIDQLVSAIKKVKEIML